MFPVRFEPTIPASARPQTYVLDCAATDQRTPARYGSQEVVMFCSWRRFPVTEVAYFSKNYNRTKILEPQEVEPVSLPPQKSPLGPPFFFAA
jgi:hypothetical protein